MTSQPKPDQSKTEFPNEGTTPLDDANHMSGDYDGASVQVLRDADHIRRRPGVYIGDISTTGLHHLVYELVYNSVDEHLAGHCKVVHVQIDVDNSVLVRDDGRGIPVDIHPTAGKPTLEVVMTTVGAGAKFDKNTYRTSAGLHGMGAKAVTALSCWTEAEVRRDNRAHMQRYEKGRAVTEVQDLGPAKGTGTQVHFKPDPEIFGDLKFDFDTLENRLRELAFLNRSLKFHLKDLRTTRDETYCYEGGVTEYVIWLNRNEEVIHAPISINKQMDQIKVEVALQFTTSEDERVRCYANNAYNPVGGTHLTGFRSALTRSLSRYGDKQDLFKNVKPIGDDFREGVTAVISIGHPEPQFESQNKIRLLNSDVEGAVERAMVDEISTFLEEHPKDAARIMRKVLLAAEAREAAAKARKSLKERRSILGGGGLPGKLFDCTSRDPAESELFLVEGDSAGGSAEAGRDRRVQAVLPLRGKPLNVEKARLENLINNQEISSLISAIGVDIGNESEYPAVKDRLRYNRIIIMTDADVDGQHIRTLLLTFFYRQMTHLVVQGHIFVARPPLYKVVQRKQSRFVATREEMARDLIERGLREATLEVHQKLGGAPSLVSGEKLTGLMRFASSLEESLVLLEKRGLNLGAFLTKRTKDGLPAFKALAAGQEIWVHSRAQAAAWREEMQTRLGRELVVGDAGSSGADIFYCQEIHEVHDINKALDKLGGLEMEISDLVSPASIAGREPAPRLVLIAGDNRKPLTSLRELVQEIRRMGEKGMTITRFKGLGEMDPEELWDTTLDPAKRTLMQVKLEDAAEAEEMFRTLMGEKVEPRRDFINKHALLMEDLDYHGA